MLVEASIWRIVPADKGHAVLVRPLESSRAVPILIGKLEMEAILIGLDNVRLTRPFTHDLMLSVIEQLGATLERVEITDIKSEIFYARLILKQGDRKVVVDSRTSDALALAARKRCPVYIAEYIVDEAGISIDLTPEEMDALSEGPDPREELQRQLEQAVAEEDYEEAARIRDQLAELDDD